METDRACKAVFKTPHISKDGTVTVCCTDFRLLMALGNVKDKHLEEIWFGDEAKELRLLHVNGKQKKILSCRYCIRDFPMPDEEVVAYLKFIKREELIEPYLQRVNSSKP